jgi:hypothetical protein
MDSGSARPSRSGRAEKLRGAFLAAPALLCALMLGFSSSAGAAQQARDYGFVPGPIALYSVKAKGTSCPAAKRVGRQWLKRLLRGDCSRFRCRSRGFICRAKPPARVSYPVTCRKDNRLVSWRISAD